MSSAVSTLPSDSAAIKACARCQAPASASSGASSSVAGASVKRHVAQRAGGVVAVHLLDGHATRGASIATPTGLPFSRATPTSRSAPGASGTKAEAPLSVTPPLPSSLACGRALDVCCRDADRHTTRPPGRWAASPAGRRLCARRLPAAPAGPWPAGASFRIAVAGRCPSSATGASTRPHSPSTSIASNASRPAPP